MVRTLVLEVSDRTYAAIQQRAEAAGMLPVDVVAGLLEQQFGVENSDRPLTHEQTARERFERHFGVVDLGYATGVENESIDADLASAYADSHGSG
jgi:hypothetical protein